MTGYGVLLLNENKMKPHYQTQARSELSPPLLKMTRMTTRHKKRYKNQNKGIIVVK